ncbi:MAG: Bro-N domain-containing protein [Desulfovibrionaceae bacterium]|nr:Bro-N domain-containing protein [Desulfovibrionaceae bacterium]
MDKDLSTILEFEGQEIRSKVESTDGKLYFSVVDVVAALLDLEYDKARRYWSDLKRKLKSEGSQLYEIIVQLKLPGKDGKLYKTDVADMEGMLRIIQSVPSPKAEPFKQWLAKVGAERIEEEANPALGIARSRERAVAAWRKQGKSEDWIEKRLKGITKRNKLTDVWKSHGIEKPCEYGALTNIMHVNCMGVTVKQHKELKQLSKKDNLRDNMTKLELACIEIAEIATTAIADARDTQGYQENVRAAEDGGKVGANSRKTMEEALGIPIVSPQNMLDR